MDSWMGSSLSFSFSGMPLIERATFIVAEQQLLLKITVISF